MYKTREDFDNEILSLCWVASGARTHDIQNHNLPYISLYIVDIHQIKELSIRSSVNYK